MKEKQAEAIEGFIENFDLMVNNLDKFSSYLQLSGTTDELRTEALAILKKKAKQMRKAEDKDDLKKAMRVNKFLEGKGLR